MREIRPRFRRQEMSIEIPDTDEIIVAESEETGNAYILASSAADSIWIQLGPFTHGHQGYSTKRHRTIEWAVREGWRVYAAQCCGHDLDEVCGWIARKIAEYYIACKIAEYHGEAGEAGA